MSTFLKKATEILTSIKDNPQSRSSRISLAIELATTLLEATQATTAKAEKKHAASLARMMQDPIGKAFLTAMTDQCFRTEDPSRTADQLTYLLRHYGIPTFPAPAERIKMLLFKIFGTYFPHFFVPLLKKQIRQELAHVLLPEDSRAQHAYLSQCRQEGTRINLNHLGEAILGNEEARHRLDLYLNDLSHSSIDYISIKISTLYSQIHLIGWEETLTILAERLRMLYRAAMQHPFTLANGEKVFKFVNLDMEESKDLDLTVALFQKVLDEPEFLSFSAGLVLQSYLPQSFSIQEQLTAWALHRKKRGGAPLKLRIVKGANLAMEKVEASFKGWTQAPFLQKEETDANFKRMLAFALEPEHAAAVHVGIGSHNLLDIAYGLILRAEKQVEEHVGFEMLQGMAPAMQRVVQQVSGSMLIYCPEAKEQDFHGAVAYLIRRLDENTGSQNFLRHLFELRPDTPEWQLEIEKFKASFIEIDSLPSAPRRKQNRFKTEAKKELGDLFYNEPDTDFSLADNRLWAKQIYREWKEKVHPPIPLLINGKAIFNTFQEGKDPSHPERVLYQYAVADMTHIDEALVCAKQQEERWSQMGHEKRSLFLADTAHLLRERRNTLIGAMIADAGKVLSEADIEVSEAIDFCEYYRKNWEKVLTSHPDVFWKPRGTLLIAPPWNFPCSIPAGGIAAALMAGNCVLFKPAPETILVGWHLIQTFWDAGIPKEVLQWINCPDDPVGSALVQDKRLNGVVLTGATATARQLMGLRPDLYLAAETGGKNPLIITSLSDRDLAIRDLVSSAFGHAGQKCSACSVAILEAGVYDDPHFLKQLRDATQSLCVGSAWNAKTKIPPLIRLPEGALKRALDALDDGESWLLEPKQDPLNPQLWSPGIKMGVQENSFTHQTELFGPVLGLMRAKNFDHAIHLANGTPYGLTSGLHSLDEREHTRWSEQIIAGNLYINRTITGAIVRRQPFGGCKASSFGRGAKAGGPNYVLQFAHPVQMDIPLHRAALPPSTLPLLSKVKAGILSQRETEILKSSVESYAHWARLFKEPTDSSSILGQDNYFYFVPRPCITLRVSKEDALLDLVRFCLAGLICDTPLEVSSSLDTDLFNDVPGVTCVSEGEERFLSRLQAGQIPSVRVFSPPSSDLLSSAADAGVYVNPTPLLANGRFELLNYLREISLSIDYHRYGHLGIREH